MSVRLASSLSSESIAAGIVIHPAINSLVVAEACPSRPPRPEVTALTSSIATGRFPGPSEPAQTLADSVSLNVGRDLSNPIEDAFALERLQRQVSFLVWAECLGICRLVRVRCVESFPNLRS